jgi:hypothetical protein
MRGYLFIAVVALAGYVAGVKFPGLYNKVLG